MLRTNMLPCEVYWLLLSIIFLRQRRLLLNKTKRKKGRKKGKCLSREIFQGEITVTIFTTNWHFIPIFSSPNNVWLGKAFRFTRQCYICSLSHNHIITCHWFNDDRRYWNINMCFLCVESQRLVLSILYLQLEGNLFEISWDLCSPDTCKTLDRIPRLLWCEDTNCDGRCELKRF